MALGERLQDPFRAVTKPDQFRKLVDKVSSCMTQLAQKPENGGHPFLFALTVPKPHEIMGKDFGECKTAATDGKKFFWHQDFLELLSPFEMSIVMMHEGYHVFLDHVFRGAGKDPRYWNWAIDYVVNYLIEKDHESQHRKGTLWGGNLGEPWKFSEVLDYLAGKWEMKKGVTYIFADVSLFGKSPEWIYDEIMKGIAKSPRKCPKCEALALDKNGKRQIPKCPDPNCMDQCPTCGAHPDSSIPSLDGHMKPKIGKEAAVQEALQAAENAKRMRGSVPAGIEELLKELQKPTLKWTDLVKTACFRKRQEAGLINDYKRSRRRLVALDIFLPKKHSHKSRVLALLDTSGSMSDDNIAYEISQLQTMPADTEVVIVPTDAAPHWEAAVSVRNMKDLVRTKIVGRGGTYFSTFLQEFRQKVGKDFDVLLIMTDGYIEQIDPSLKPAGMDVVFVLCNDYKDFKPPFGRVAPLRNDRA